jgi:glycine/D-amino acid oxidase-like deaminating enzyme
MLGIVWPFQHNRVNRIRSSDAYWLLRNGIGDARPALTKSLDCDVVVVGAGITGALIADGLVGRGARVVVLDARDVASGSTAASTALLQYEIDTHLVDLVEQIGEQRALQAYRACVDTFPRLERRFPELLKLANYRRRDSLYLAHEEAAVPALRAELAARRAVGIDCEWLDQAELTRRYGCRRPGGILSRLAAELDPVRFTQALMLGIERHGVPVFCRTRIRAVEERGARLAVVSEAGPEVHADHVVVAAGYESLAFVPRKVASIANTYALVTEPLPERVRVDTMPMMWESARPYLYLRGTPDGRLMIGGADLPFKNAGVRDLSLPRQVRRLARDYQALFGEELPPVAHAWGGTFANTRDGLPYIGAVPGLNPRLQFALCYGGNGITYSVHAAEIIGAHLESRPHALDAVFGFEREGADAAGAGAAPNPDQPGTGQVRGTRPRASTYPG